jgi:hypothetical protein
VIVQLFLDDLFIIVLFLFLPLVVGGGRWWLCVKERCVQGRMQGMAQ